MTGLTAQAFDAPFDPVASLYEKGNDYFRKGSYSSAVSVFQLVVDNHADHVLAPESLFSIASAQHKMGDKAAAKQTYEDLLKRYPTASALPDALLQLGALYGEMGDPVGARSTWSRLISEYKGSIAAKIAEQRLSSVPAAPVSAPLAPERPSVSRGHEAKAEHAKEHAPEAIQTPAKERVEHPEEPSAGSVYIVKKNDSISGIAKKLWGSMDRNKELARFNKLSPPYALKVGQILRIPGGTVMESPAAGTETYDPMFDEHTAKPAAAAPAKKEKDKSPAVKPPAPEPVPAWQAEPMEDMEKAAGSIEKWVDERSEGYEALQKRLLEMQQDVRAQKLMEKQLELLKSQLDHEQKQNNGLKKEIIEQVEKLKDLKDRNVSLTSQIQSLTDAVERTKAIQSRNAELDAQIKSYKQKMDTMDKQNQTLSETLQKMRDAFDAQMALVKAYYDSQLEQARQDYEIRMDTTEAELSRLREESRKKDQSLNELKRDYTELIKKTATIQKEMIEEKQKTVSTSAAKQALERAQDLKRAGKTREAEASYKEALSIYPEFADAMNELAFLYAEENRNLEEAEKLVERAIAVDPDGRGYFLDTLGWILYVRKAYAPALDALLESHRQMPTENLPARAAVHFHIGKVYQAISDKDKAFFHFIDAIKLAPRTRWATLSERELDAL